MILNWSETNEKSGRSCNLALKSWFLHPSITPRFMLLLTHYSFHILMPSSISSWIPLCSPTYYSSITPSNQVISQLISSPRFFLLVIFITSFLFYSKKWFFFLGYWNFVIYFSISVVGVCGLQSWWGACMCTGKGMKRKGQLRGSLCFQSVAPMWKCRLPQFLNLWNPMFLECSKGTRMECGYVSLRIMLITLLDFTGFLRFCWSQGISS